MKIIHKDVDKLTETEFKACRLANYGAGGYMREELDGCRDPRSLRTGRAIMLWDGPKDKITSLRGWALLTPVRTWGVVAGSPWNKKKAKYTVQFWIKRQYRKNGLATKLMDEVIKLDPCPHVFPHNKSSGNFFSNYNITASAFDRNWIKKKRPAA